MIVKITYTSGENNFQLNGYAFARVFHALAMGTDSIAIYNAQDTKQQILGSTHFDRVTLNGESFPDQQSLIKALIPVLLSEGSNGGDTTNGDLAYSWGDHGQAGYITQAELDGRNYITGDDLAGYFGDEGIPYGIERVRIYYVNYFDLETKDKAGLLKHMNKRGFTIAENEVLAIELINIELAPPSEGEFELGGEIEVPILFPPELDELPQIIF